MAGAGNNKVHRQLLDIRIPARASMPIEIEEKNTQKQCSQQLRHAHRTVCDLRRGHVLDPRLAAVVLLQNLQARGVHPAAGIDLQ